MRNHIIFWKLKLAITITWISRLLMLNRLLWNSSPPWMRRVIIWLNTVLSSKLLDKGSHYRLPAC
jgi:hypothetical protein